jgi:hypothetical protein
VERFAVTGRQFPKRGAEPEILIRTNMMRRRFDSRVNSELLLDALDVGMNGLPGESDLAAILPAPPPCAKTSST